MSDEHEDHEHPNFPFVMQIGPTKEQLDQEEMHKQSVGHDFIDFLSAMDVDQLGRLQNMIKAVIQSDGEAGHYYVGIIHGMLQFKHNLCIVCGNDHDKSLHDMMGDEPVINTVPRMSCCDELADKPHLESCPLMEEYGMAPDDAGSLHVQCIRCETWSGSLEDRMLRQPGIAGCQQCIHKTQWG